MKPATARAILVLSSLIAALGGAALLRAILLVHPERDSTPGVVRRAGIDKEGKMQTLTDSWTSKGVEKSVTTARMEQEELKAFLARHQELVKAYMEVCPPDGVGK